jgi:multidrug efflux pump subunit AcrA (membrane-fusion protein)
MMTKKFLFFLPTVLTGLFLTACTGTDQIEKQEKIIPVKVMSAVETQHATSLQNYVGTVEETFASSLGFSGMGSVSQVFVTEGQTVEKGQLLAELDNSTAQTAFNAAHATLLQAHDAYERMAKLHKNGSISEIKFVERIKKGCKWFFLIHLRP